MRCRCCNKRLTKFYVKLGKTHCGSCARGVSAGSSYSDIVLGLAAEAKCHEYALRLERLAAKHRNDQLVGMETKRAERLRAVWASIKPMIRRLAYKGKDLPAKWWCGTCNTPLTIQRCVKCEFEATHR